MFRSQSPRPPTETTPMPPEEFAEFYAGSYRRLLRQLFAITGDLADATGVPGGAGHARRARRGPRRDRAPPVRRPGDLRVQSAGVPVLPGAVRGQAGRDRD